MGNVTYQDLQSRICGELLRTDLSAQIVTAIGRAIEKYASRRFWFNENTVAAACTAGEQYVTVAGLRWADKVFADYSVSGPPGYPLKARSLAEIEEAYQAVSTTGQPTDYCTLDGQLRLYRLPNLNYPLQVVGVFDLPALVNAGDQNAWTTTAQDLICAEAKRNINRGILRDVEAAALDKQDRDAALSALVRETTRRTSSGRIQPSD